MKSDRYLSASCTWGKMCVKKSCALTFYIFPHLMKRRILANILWLQMVLLAVMQPYEKAQSSPNWIYCKLKTLVIAGACFLPFQTHTL